MNIRIALASLPLALFLVSSWVSTPSYAANSARTGSAVVTAREEREVDVGVSSLFVPPGFDSNSETYVVASGVFPNSCYRWSRATVNTNADGVIEVQPKAKVRSGMCMMVLVPFSTEVALGKLSTGEHIVRFLGGDGTYLEKKIVIE